MQKGDKKDRKMATSVEIVDVPPRVADNETILKTSNLSAGATTLSKEELHHLFQIRNLVFLGTLSKDGSPHVTPVWAEMVDGLIMINTFESSAKNKNITNDKRIALSVVEHDNPFNMVSIKGRVIEQTAEEADEHLKRVTFFILFRNQTRYACIFFSWSYILFLSANQFPLP